MDLRNAEWIFFDMGFTLVDESDEHRRRAAVAIAEAAEHGGKEIGVDEFEELTYRLGAEGRPPFSRACRRIGAKYVPYTGECEKPYPDAAETLDRLSAKYRLGVIANQLPGAAERLHRFGLDSYISLVISSADVGIEKPDPAIFLLALEKAGCEPHASSQSRG